MAGPTGDYRKKGLVSTLEVSKPNQGADHGPVPTRSTVVPAVAPVCPDPQRVAHATPGVAGHRLAVGSAYGVAASGSAAAARDSDRARRLDRTTLAPHSCGHGLGRRRDLLRAGTCECATAASRPVCAGAGRYPADHPLHVEHAGTGLRRPCPALGVVSLVGSATRRVLDADRAPV